MRELRALFRKGLPPLIEELEKVTSELRLGETDVADEARRLAHQLKGSGGSFGYPKVTRAAREVLQSSPQEMVATLDTLLATMRYIVTDEGPIASQILVIDDDPLIQQLLMSTLQGHSREVILASSLLGAEPLLGSGLSLIILDLFLPDGDGRHVIKQIRAAPETELTPILVLSGASSSLAKAECLELGADAFIEKPFAPDDLLEAVDQILHGIFPAEVTDQELDGSDSGPPPSCTILLAEDDALTATLVKDRLLRSGFEVIHCTNGRRALDIARSETLAMAILDVKMPRMDGFELLARIRELPQLAEMPVMMLTAMGSEHDVVRGFELGANDYVLKPFSPAELVARVDRLLAVS